MIRGVGEGERHLLDRKGESVFVSQCVRKVTLWLMTIGKNPILLVMERE